MRRVALVAAGFLLLVVVAVAGTGTWLLRDASRFISNFEAAATRALGRPVHIGSLQIHPDLTIEALRVTVNNPPGLARPEMLILPRVVGSIGLLGLFSGVVDVTDIRLEHPNLRFDVADFSHAPDPPSEPATGSRGGRFIRLRSRIGAVTIVDGHAVIGGFPIDVTRARVSHQADGWHLTASLASRGDTAEVTGTRPDAGGFTIDATGQVTLPPDLLLLDPLVGSALGRSDVTAHVGSDATRVKILRGVRSVTVTTAPVGDLGAPGPQPVDVLIEQPGSSMQATGHAARDGGFDAVFDGRTADLAMLSPRLPAGPASLTTHAGGHVSVGMGFGVFHIALDRMVLTTTAGDLTGNVAIADDGPTPSLTATLAAKSLDGDALLRSLRAPEPQPTAAQPSAAAVPTAPVPVANPFARLRNATGDVVLSADALTLGGVSLHAARVHAALADGRLVLDPVSADTIAGPVRASVTIDAGGQLPTIVLMLQAPSLKLTDGPITGTATVRAALNTAGETADTLLANLVGSASVAAVDGELDPTAIAPALLEVTRKLPVKVTIGPTHFRCVVLRMSAIDGVATVAPITLDTPRLTVAGQGTVDLRARTLSLKIRPVLRSGIGLSLPATVSGGWEAPIVGSDPHPDPVVKGDACSASLAAIGVALPLPPPTAAQKPADLLRGLLR